MVVVNYFTVESWGGFAQSPIHREAIKLFPNMYTSSTRERNYSDFSRVHRSLGLTPDRFVGVGHREEPWLTCKLHLGRQGLLATPTPILGTYALPTLPTLGAVSRT